MLQGYGIRRYGGDMDVKMYQSGVVLAQSLWRNGIARWTSNPEAPGSSPGRDEPDRTGCGRIHFIFIFFFTPNGHFDDADVLVLYLSVVVTITIKPLPFSFLLLL